MSTANVVRMVNRGIAADNRGEPVADMRMAAHLHRQMGERLSALQYTEMADDKEKEVEGGVV